jgi:glutamyl-tRNA synthetase
MSSKIRLRFAPSPTGYLHIGSLRTALFNYLAVKNLGGDLILRIEDTDEKREVAGATEQLIAILDWLNIKFDEGPHLDGKFGPYLQSQRQSIYKKYAEELLKKDGAYYCFCSEEDLEKMRARQVKKKLPPHYDRTCRNLTKAEAENKINNGQKFSIRQKLPLTGEVNVKDELRGEIRFKAENLDDHILIKSNGVPTYQFASVVDDHLMEISHVLRGDEWISSFPKNILLYKSFGWKPPQFVHIPLILNKEGGGKLSKRQGDVTVESYKEKGYLPEALLNFCALLGWHPKGENEILNISELIKEFKINDIGINPAIFDLIKLDYFNGYYIRQKNTDEISKMCEPYLKDLLNKTGEKRKTEEYIRQVVRLEQERLKKLEDIAEATSYFFIDNFDYKGEMLIWKNNTASAIKNNLEKIYELLEKVPADIWTKHSTKDMVVGHIENSGGKTGDYLWPLRVALTGRKGSPGPFEVAEVLGKEESLKRIKRGIGRL